MNFKNLESILQKAYKSKFWLGILNIVLSYVIPFNRPHKFKIKELTQNSITVHIPYIRKNLNHLKGIHACALATASEYACGFLLISRMSSSKYRLIMRSMHVDYTKQGKTDLKILFKMEENKIEELKNKLSNSSQCLEILEVEVRDINDSLISIARLEWQLKEWKNIGRN